MITCSVIPIYHPNLLLLNMNILLQINKTYTMELVIQIIPNKFTYC